MNPGSKMLTTYGRRRKRTAYAMQKRDENPSSSPLEELPVSKEDLTFEEMSSRMKKRSRQASSSYLDINDDNLANHHDRSDSYKSSKRVVRPDVALSTEGFAAKSSLEPFDVLPVTPLLTGNGQLLPLGTQRVNDSIFETPFPSDQTILQSYLVTMQDEPMSPVPLGRRILSRTSSRSFKENKTHTRSLASPFNSRPVSRSPSPIKVQGAMRPALHSKSRTLSSTFLRQYKKAPIVSQDSTVSAKDSIFDSARSAQASTYQTKNDKTASLYSHGRTASIPNISSHLLDDISAEDWLVPPKALRRSTLPQDEMHLDVFQADSPSFYFDMPNEVSTPSRKRQTTVTYKNAHNRETASTYQDIWSDDEDVTTLNPQESPRQPGRRRRTIVHMSSDSIFSSALDFSAYMSDASPTPVCEQAVASPAVTVAPKDPFGIIKPALATLDPAFSPASVPVSQSGVANAPTDPADASSVALTQRTGQDSTYNASSSPRHMVPVVNCVSRLLSNNLSIDDGLHGMLSKLALGEHTAEDSDVGLNDIPELSQSSTSNTGRSQNMTHRRKRGDTIRAADFPRTSESAGLVSPMRFSSRSSHTDLLPPNTRRTRSGTVTLAKSVARQGSLAQPITRSKVARRRDGLPTIKRRIDDPLPQQGSDEEDDPLLIKNSTIVLDELKPVEN